MTRAGFALPVVILIAGVVLFSMITATSVSGLGSRVNTSDEKVAYQALLAAESGINSFAQRLTALGYPADQPFEAADLNSWLDAEPGRATLRTLSLSSSVTAGLEVLPSSAADTVAVRATGSVAGGRGKKVVLQNFTRPVGGPVTLGVPAALISVPEVGTGGNASVHGSDFDNDTGIFSAVTSASSSVTASGSFDLSVSDTALLQAGRYVQIGGESYRIEAVDAAASKLSLQNLDLNPATITAGAQLDMVAFALTQTPPNAFDLTFNETDGFLVGDCIKIGTYRGAISALDSATGGVTVNWNVNMSGCAGGTVPPLSALSEGSPVVRKVYAVESKGFVNDFGAQPNVGGNESYSSRLAEGDDLFTQMLGVSKAVYMSQSTELSSLQSDTTYTGKHYYEGSFNGKGFCGTGIIFIKGDVQLTAGGPALSCGDGFRGLIYVEGDFDYRGNMRIDGAIVVEGGSSSGSTSVTGTGQCGTGQGGGSGGRGRGGGGSSSTCDPKLEYDLLALLEASELIQTDAPISAVKHTWRQR